ncbi:hypothetical protein [Sphingomonas aracearum]|uniref:ATP-binding protein n=1 Tax=Sphingomonas aracearum TaxID=2283317 RepID=A0A369VQL2_9SPHN|nr:hypothetical protein [Sphingomonas aracearum]RDE04674.1 hypothetical protein DVW87_13870 [Sphingomonas aracearum]
MNLRRYFLRQPVLRACELFRNAYLRDKRDVILDFSRTRLIQADAMLVLVAEVDRAMRMGLTKQVIRCKLPNGVDQESQIVCEVLEQVELLKRIGQQSPAAKRQDNDFHESVRHWRYATGTRVDEKPGDVLDQHEGRISEGLMTGVQTGLSEALVNSLHHAYRADRLDGCAPFNERRWWMFTREANGLLDVLVCDLGIGIPRSLPLSWDRNLLKKLMGIFGKSSPDVASIQMALILGETSTGEVNRGKGLPQIWNATRTSSAGSVGILSGKAYVGYDVASGEEFSGSYESSLLGTLVNWTFPVDAADAVDG